MSSLPTPNISTTLHSEARAKIGQRVVTLKEGKGHKPVICIGHVVAVELPFIYSGSGHEESAEPIIFVVWEGIDKVDCLSWEEYQSNLQEI